MSNRTEVNDYGEFGLIHHPLLKPMKRFVVQYF